MRGKLQPHLSVFYLRNVLLVSVGLLPLSNQSLLSTGACQLQLLRLAYKFFRQVQNSIFFRPTSQMQSHNFFLRV